MSTTIPLAEVRARLSPLVGSVEQTHERIVITKNGKPAAVLISYDDLESLEETLEILADPEALSAIKASLADETRFTLDEIRRDLASRSSSTPGHVADGWNQTLGVREADSRDQDPDLLSPSGMILRVKPGLVGQRLVEIITSAQIETRSTAEMLTTLRRAFSKIDSALEVVDRGTAIFVVYLEGDEDVDILATLERPSDAMGDLVAQPEGNEPSKTDKAPTRIDLMKALRESIERARATHAKKPTAKTRTKRKASEAAPDKRTGSARPA
jgi:prevent-host-death family protein